MEHAADLPLEPSPSPRILVTGCAGFIGSRVTELLLDAGATIVGVDELNDAYDVRLKEWRLTRLLDRPRFVFRRETVTGPRLRETFHVSGTNGSGSPFDAVIHLAARAGVRQSVENPGLYLDTNATGTLRLLELCRDFAVPKFVLASTSSLYGARMNGAFREDVPTDLPLSPYAASKKAAELLCHTFHYLYGLDVTVLRYFTVYGPAGRPDMSLFRFVQWISEGKPVQVHGDGRQSRDFTFVDDIARGTCAALRPLGFETINLGSDRPVPLIEAIRLVEERVGRTADLHYQDRHPADVPGTWANVQKAANLLHWHPRIALEEGIDRLVGWYEENRPWASQLET